MTVLFITPPSEEVCPKALVVVTGMVGEQRQPIEKSLSQS